MLTGTSTRAHIKLFSNICIDYNFRHITVDKILLINKDMDAHHL